ncbi:MAG TPA: SRPBCC domain-containing protein [Capillimicrobium sp.]|nr:SRPBCC domain-containing protein [Capillimicrobium sp.]
MAATETFIAAPPDRVFEVLSDPECYARWVVGSDSIRDADPDFPAVGSRFHHRVGFGPLKIDDHTEVLDAHPPYRLELKAKARPLGTFRVVLLLSPRGEGTHVTMIEEPGDLLTSLLYNPVTHLLTRGRNDEALRRLKALAEDPARTAAASTA